jgi:aldose 1-epimerase
MFTRSTKQIKGLETITYTYAPSGVAISIIPELGALIHQLVLALDNRTFDILDTPVEDEMPSNPIYKSSLLAPFPNRVDGGKYAYEGKEYQLPINEGERNNAIHGFISHLPFLLTDETITGDTLSLTLNNSYTGDYPGYPFPFDTEVSISLSPEKGLACKCIFTNTGPGPLPFGFAWHPYFTLGARVDDLELKLPICKLNEVTDRLIPTGRLRPYPDFEKGSKIGDRFIDNCFVISDNNSPAETIIRNPAEKFAVRIWQDAGAGKLSHLVVYTPPGRSTLAVEPQSCNIDAFNNHQGLIHLEKNKKTEMHFGVSLLP